MDYEKTIEFGGDVEEAFEVAKSTFFAARVSDCQHKRYRP